MTPTVDVHLQPDDLIGRQTGSLVGILKAAKFDVGAGFLPGGPVTTSPVCPTGGAGIGIPKAIPKERQLAAATFLKFLTTPENTVTFPFSSTLPSALAISVSFSVNNKKIRPSMVSDNTRL